ncbi:MAG TPA: hypothetical protein VG797_03345 [Phycisphaerales bacterium]|nr:hypothetical protein [Phycisphaerales bacterium]
MFRGLLAAVVVAGAVLGSGGAARAGGDDQTMYEKYMQAKVDLGVLKRAKGENDPGVKELEARIADMHAQIYPPTPTAQEMNLHPFDYPVTLDFPGGTVEQYIEAVQSSAGVRCVVSFLAKPGIPFPKVSLKGARVASAIGVLNSYEGDTAGGATHYKHAVRQEDDLLVVRQEIAERGKTDPFDPRGQQSRVFAIKSLIDGGLKTEDVLSAVEAALKMSGSETTMNYHRETALLMARGGIEQMATIDQVLDRLEGDVKRSLKEKEPDNTVLNLRVSVQQLAKQLETMQAALQEQTKHMKELELELSQKKPGRAE